MECTGELGRFLADHGVHHQQHLIGLHGATDAHHLLHHRRVDLEASRRVDDDRVKAPVAAVGEAGGGNRLRWRVSPQAEDLNADLPTQGLQLIDGRRPIHVGRHQQRAAPLLPQVQPQLGGGGGLACPLQACHQHHGWGFGRPGQGGLAAAHHLHQLVVDDLDELLIGGDPSHHLGAEGGLAHLIDELLHHRQADVGLKQRPAHIPQGCVDVALADGRLTAETTDGLLEPLGQFLEHQAVGDGGLATLETGSRTGTFQDPGLKSATSQPPPGCGCST